MRRLPAMMQEFPPSALYSGSFSLNFFFLALVNFSPSALYSGSFSFAFFFGFGEFLTKCSV